MVWLAKVSRGQKIRVTRLILSRDCSLDQSELSEIRVREILEKRERFTLQVSGKVVIVAVRIAETAVTTVDLRIDRIVASLVILRHAVLPIGKEVIDARTGYDTVVSRNLHLVE